MHITIRQLRAFEAVARLLSFSRAAEEIHITQPSISKQIRLLNEQVGLPLLELHGKKVSLTEAGQELYETSIEWLDTLSRFEQTIANLKGLKQGHLRISTVTTAKFFMPRILGPFCAQYPGIDITLEVINRDRLLDRLSNNVDELYIMGVPPEGIDIESKAFMDNPLVVLAPASHPLSGRKNIPFSDLASEGFLVRERGSGTRLIIERVFEEHKLPLKIKMCLGSNEAIKQAVAGGLGLAVLSRSSLNLSQETSELAILDVQGFPIMRAWYIVHPKGRQLSVVARTFQDFLLAHVELLVPRQSTTIACLPRMTFVAP